MNAYIQLIRERGIPWFVYRGIYSIKLKTLGFLPWMEKVFEKKVHQVKQINLFEIDTELLKRTLRQLPQREKKALINQAESACFGKIQGFSSCPLDYGFPIDWQRNPITGKSINSLAKWYRIPDFDKQVGDIKVIWEISRFSHFFLFARAYLLTDDIRYYKAFSEHLSDWLQKNPYTYGANFKCGQECAIRMLSCLMVYPIFQSMMTQDDVKHVEELVLRCYKKILSNFSYAYKSQNNNHTLSELAGMIAGAWCTNDERRLKWAYRVLNKVILKQFSIDGGYIQQSFNYQRVALQDIEAVLRMNAATGRDLSREAKGRVLNSVLQMFQCQDTSGDMPNYGANDGALIFPVTSCGYRDFTPCINTVYALLTGKKLYEAGKHEEELIWFGLEPNIPQDRVVRESKQFKESGLYTLRTKTFWLMLVSKKKFSHMDQNHLDLWVNGINVLCDSGTFSYADDLGRELFATKAHNTICCADKEQINRIGAFAVYGQPKGVQVHWTENAIISEIQFSSGYTHIRTIQLAEDGFDVLDEVKALEGVHPNAKALFHTPLNVLMKSETEAALGKDCLLISQTPVKLLRTKRSLYYQQHEDTHCIEITLANGQAFTKIKIQSDGGNK